MLAERAEPHTIELTLTCPTMTPSHVEANVMPSARRARRRSTDTICRYDVD